MPTAIVGLSHGKIYDDHGALVDRTDSLPNTAITRLIEKSEICLVRDRGTFEMLRGEAAGKVKFDDCDKQESYSLLERAESLITRLRHRTSACQPEKLGQVHLLQGRAIARIRP